MVEQRNKSVDVGGVGAAAAAGEPTLDAICEAIKAEPDIDGIIRTNAQAEAVARLCRKFAHPPSPLPAPEPVATVDLWDGPEARLGVIRWKDDVALPKGTKLYAGAAPAPAGWRSIESAPKDGTYILIYDDGYQSVACWFTSKGGKWWDGQCDGDDCPVYNTPTHWMPLPEPPEETK